MIPVDAATLTAAFATLATEEPEAPALTFLAAGEPPQPLGRGLLHASALATAGRLVEAGIAPGNVVLIAGEHDARLVTLALGSLYAGALPAIAPYPSAFNQATRYDQRLLDVAQASQARALLALPDVKARLVAPLAALGCAVLDGSTLAAAMPGQASLAPFDPSPDMPAYVQFSSGTTGTPKGAVVNHAAALQHLRALVTALQLSEGDVLCGWAPFFHDLGLVFYLLLPLASGIPAVTMAPDYWVRRPQSLLRALHDYRGTVCVMPNFGYAHTTRNVRGRDLEGLDLSSVRHMIAGAEVVQPETLDAFIARFGPLGLAHEALGVGYGMTECVFMATLTPPGKPPQLDQIVRQVLLAERRALPDNGSDTLAVISCGVPLPETAILILDEQGQTLPERLVGEVVIVSPTLCDGYLHLPDLTLGALRKGRLHTGDLGYRADGEIFVVDRKKDLIIAAGKHIYPETLEQLALAELGDAGSRAAAFGVRSAELGTEAPVLVCEVRGQLADADAVHLAEAIRQRVQQGADVALVDVRLVRRGWLEVTTSGKVARSATREKYLAAGYGPQPPSAALSPNLLAEPAALEGALTALAGQMLAAADLQASDNLFTAGGDSLTVVRFVIAVEEQLGVQVGAEFFRTPTTADLTRLLCPQSAAQQLPSRAGTPAAPRRTHKRRHEGWVRKGPLVRGRALLPYGLGVRLQRAWLALPGARRQFSTDIELVQRWGELVGLSDYRASIEASLLANTWRDWRDRALATPLGASPWVRVLGDPTVWQQRPGPGTIFMPLHTPLSSVFLRGLAADGVGFYSVHGATDETDVPTQDRALQIYRARDVLGRGGCVILAGDGGKGGQGVALPFFGGQRMFRQGAAELAVETGAGLVPVFCTMAPDGYITIEVCPPLSAPPGSYQDRVATLTRAYAELVVARWPQVFPSHSWGSLATWLRKLAEGVL